MSSSPPPDATPPVTRLHISGLYTPPTSTLTPQDIASRISRFPGCSVKSLVPSDFEKLDGVGRKRGWGYVDVGGGRGDVAKCLTALSGAVWKGARLRIGEAKPDFRERLAKERSLPPPPPPLKRRRLSKYTGIPAASLEPITREKLLDPDTASKALYPNWKVTPMGRVVRVMRMRPGRPLEPTIEEERERRKTTRVNAKGKGDKAKGKEGDGKEGGKRKRKRREPDVRARRRMIDPLMWGSTLLSGVFLEGDVELAGAKNVEMQASGSEDEDVSEEEEDEEGMVLEDLPIPIPQERDFDLELERERGREEESQPSLSLVEESNKSLALLKSMFGGADDDAGGEWVGRESLSDIDVDVMSDSEGDLTRGEGNKKGTQVVPREEEEDDTETMDVDANKDDPPVKTVEPATTEIKRKGNNLKDLFAPPEEAEEAHNSGGFSLLAHLDLDLDPDFDVDVDLGTAMQHQQREPDITLHSELAVTEKRVLKTITTPAAQSRSTPLTFDPTTPLFFPLPSSFSPTHPAPTTTHQNDLLTAFRSKSWDWRSAKFYRTQNEDEIRKRWEDEKGELTRGWKRRCREAGKVRRRAGGRRDGDE